MFMVNKPIAKKVVAKTFTRPLPHVSEGNILLYPITTERAIAMIELENKLVFVVAPNATKPQIKKEVERLFKVKVGAVNTKITVKGLKQAYVRLKEGKADDIAAALKIV